MEIDLERASLEELREARSQIDRAIGSFQDRKRKDAMTAAEAAIREHGFSSLSELTRTRRGRSGTAKPSRGAPATNAARYAHPEDPSLTWSGRGRRPRWVGEHLEAGKSLDDLAV